MTGFEADFTADPDARATSPSPAPRSAMVLGRKKP